VTHPEVDRVTFTGSRAIGQHILSTAGGELKRVTLELGGKSPNIIFPDVESLDVAAATAIGMVSLGLSGQGCICLTRALIHRDIYDDVVERAISMRAMAVPGDPFDESTTAGPLVNSKQLGRVLGFIETGRHEGARLVVGGERIGGDLAEGYFVEPTLFADVDNAMTIAQEEIFGPVLAAIPFKDEDEAIALANDTSYGLGASVFTSDVNRALRMARAIRAGTVGINHYAGVLPVAPFGGFKHSGLGREGGLTGIEEFTELKTIMLGG
jgi:aldehyde dehydrogenase (NAD+)